MIDMWTVKENSRKITLTVSIVVIVILILSVSTYLITTSNTDEGLLIKYAKDSESELKLLIKGDRVVEVNASGKETLIKYSLSNTAKESPLVEKGDVLPRYNLFPETKVIDPVSYGSIEEIPNTYISTLNQSADYIQTMNSIGWETKEVFCDQQYCEHFLYLSDAVVRVIVTESKLKINNKFKGKIYSARTYISEL